MAFGRQKLPKGRPVSASPVQEDEQLLRRELIVDEPSYYSRTNLDGPEENCEVFTIGDRVQSFLPGGPKGWHALGEESYVGQCATVIALHRALPHPYGVGGGGTIYEVVFGDGYKTEIAEECLRRASHNTQAD